MRNAVTLPATLVLLDAKPSTPSPVVSFSFVSTSQALFTLQLQQCDQHSLCNFTTTTNLVRCIDVVMLLQDTTTQNAWNRQAQRAMDDVCSAPPVPSTPPLSPVTHLSPSSTVSAASNEPKTSTKGAVKTRRTIRTLPGLRIETRDAITKSKDAPSSNFSSPLPPCPEDPPAPPPPSFTPPKYRPLEENEDDTRSVESADEPIEPQNFPTPPPPPSPPVTSPMGTPPPPPPPPFSPPSTKITLDLSGALDSVVQVTKEMETPILLPGKRDESDGEDGDDEREEVLQPTDLATLADTSSSSVIASMRSAVGEKEIMATDFVRDVPVKKPRFYIGDIDNYSIIDKVGSGTYGYVFVNEFETRV